MCNTGQTIKEAKNDLLAFFIAPNIGKPIPKKTELFRRNKVRLQENMSVSGSGLCEGSIYIFLNFLVLFVSRQKGQLKKCIIK